MRTPLTLPRFMLLAAAGGLSLVLAAMAGGQAPPPKAAPPVDPNPQPADAKLDRPKGFAPFFTLSQALVERDGDDTLKVWVQVPVSRFLKLTDAKGRPVHVHDSTYRELGPQSVSVGDVELYDVAGEKKAKADWKNLLKGRTQVLYVMKAHHDPKSLREQFAVFLKGDALVLVVSEEVFASFEPFKNLPEIESLPQAFPGQPAKPGDPTPPPKK